MTNSQAESLSPFGFLANSIEFYLVPTRCAESNRNIPDAQTFDFVMNAQLRFLK